jgi:hypothetical protein
LRNIRSVVGHGFGPESAPYRLYELAIARALPTFTKGKRLSDAQVASLKKELSAYVVDNYLPFAAETVKQRIGGFETILATTDCFYYMLPSRSLLAKPTDRENEFSDDVVDMRFTRIAADRKRVIIDDLSCNILFSNHALSRMIERDACERKPIDFLRQNAFSILPFVPLLVMMMIKSDVAIGCMIPLGDGVLLGNYMINTHQSVLDREFRRRAAINKAGCGLTPLPVWNPFRDHAFEENNNIALRMTTFIDHNALTPSQEWARDQLNAFIKRNENAIPALCAIMTSPEIMGHPEFTDIVFPVFDDFLTIIEHPMWAKANRL